MLNSVNYIDKRNQHVRIIIQKNHITLFCSFITSQCSLSLPGVDFLNILLVAFTLVDPKSIEKDWQLDCHFYAFGIFAHKSYSLNVDEIEPRLIFVPKLFLALLFNRNTQFFDRIWGHNLQICFVYIPKSSVIGFSC